MKLPRVLDCSYDDYLADNIGAKIPTLNASVAKVIIQKSPAHAVLEHPKLGGTVEDESSKSMDKGSIIHSLLLGKGKAVAVVSADNWRTKVAQEQRDEARKKGLIPLLEKDALGIQQAALAISQNISEYDIHLDEGKSEFMIHWKSQERVECRRSLDSWTESKLQIIELKSIFCAHPEVCSNQALRLGYDIEMAVSLDAIYSLYPDHLGRVDFLFVFCEIEPPYAVTVLRPDGTFTHLGIQKWERAKSIWKQCMTSGEWPKYLDVIGQLSAPMWALKGEMEELYENV
jgi:hypothetical protein